MTDEIQGLHTPKKASTLCPTRAIARDRRKRTPRALPSEEIEFHLRDLIHPLTRTHAQRDADLGVRERTLSLPVRGALVLRMIWRQVGSVSTLTRMLHREGLLWTAPVRVRQQALSLRFRSFPADLFHRVLDDLLPQMQARWAARTHPLPAELAWARDRGPRRRGPARFPGSTSRVAVLRWADHRVRLWPGGAPWLVLSDRLLGSLIRMVPLRAISCKELVPLLTDHTPDFLVLSFR